jgi:group I intron endonuclease
MIVYLIRNEINGKCYVGQTSLSLLERWTVHVGNVKAGRTSRFCNAIRKYGIEAFSTKVLYRAKTEQELLKMETFFIILHQSHRPENGYNMTLGGEQNPMKFPEVRAKASATALRKIAAGVGNVPSHKGFKHPYKPRPNATGRTVTEKTRAALRAAWLTRKAEGRPVGGRPRSQA